MELAILIHIDQHKFVNLRSLQVLKPFSNASVCNAAAAQISRQFRHESICSMQQSYCVLAHSSFLGLLLQVSQRYKKYILTNILSSNSAARGVAWQLDSYMNANQPNPVISCWTKSSVKLLIVSLNSAVSVREHCQVVNHSQVLKALKSYLLYQDLGADCGFCCCMHGFIRACLLIYLVKFFQRRQRMIIF